jgi:hypothetical protein
LSRASTPCCTSPQYMCYGAQPGARVGAILGPSVHHRDPNTNIVLWGTARGTCWGHSWPQCAPLCPKHCCAVAWAGVDPGPPVALPAPPVPHATAGELGPSFRGRPQVASAPLTSPLLGASPRSPVRRSQPRRPGTMACLHAGIYILVFSCRETR